MQQIGLHQQTHGYTNLMDLSLDAEPSADDDDPLVRVQRERYQELVQELRILLPGVQVLFAFLLTTPFTGRFDELSSAQRAGYLAALMLTAAAAIVFMAPVVGHRLAPREARTDRLRQAIILKLVGSTLLLLAMTTATGVVVSFVYDDMLAVAGVGVLIVMVIVLWVVLPLSQSENDSVVPNGE